MRKFSKLLLTLLLIGAVMAMALTTNQGAIGSQLPLEPLAFGFINQDGEVGVGTSNVISAEWDALALQYVISLESIPYWYGSFATMVSPRNRTDGLPLMVMTDSLNGNLVVIFYDIMGNRHQSAFQFVTFQP
jgi:hypothetical protein